MRRIIGIILCFMLILGGIPMVTLCASAEVAFAMPNYFADNMMFQRNKDMNLFGVSTPGKTILGEFYETNTTVVPVEKVSVTVPADGNWTLSFAPREGSYQHYRIVIYENNVVMRVIHTVYIGELWLAAGQSNMEYRLDWEKDGAAEIAAANDPYLRVLLMTGNPVGTSGTPRSTPAFDIHGAVWIDGTNKTYIGSVSANAYYACKQLREKLDMPVGFINAALGSTNIQTWLSRESIDGNQAVKTALTQNNLYITAQQAGTKAADYRDMCAMFNTKVGPLAGMNLGGLFWCQGESNRDGAPNNDGFYKEAIGALAQGYSSLFGYSKGDMPVIVINIANHPYLNDPQNIPKWIEEIADAAKTNPSIVSIPIYDVPLTYKNPPDPSVAYSIHPNTKKPGGTRAGLAAYHNFCKEGKGDYYAPAVSSYEVKNGAIYVTFANAVNGLTTLNNSIGVHGFTIAGDDGLFLPAQATIQDKNVVKIWNDSLEQPINFTYAFNSHAQTANLCNSYNLPAVPFRSNRDMKNYFGSNDWMYCEDTTVFVNDGLYGDYQTTWQSSGPATIGVDTATRYEGTGSLRLNYTLSGVGTAAAVATYGQYLMPFSVGNYQTVSVMVRNGDARNKSIRLLLGIQGTNELWCLGLANNANTYQATVAASSDFTKYTFAVNNIQGYTTNAAINLSQINRMDILVEDTASGSIYIDGITVGSSPVDLEPFTEYTENLIPIYHVALTTATASDPTWNDYNYIGQEFIPKTETISGVKLPLHLSDGNATLHLEIRSTVNGTALASANVELSSKGNSVQWYDVSLGQNLAVKPYRMYYFVYYLTARNANSICIAYGRDLGMNGAVHYGYAWPMANGGTPNLTSVSNQLQFGFEIIETKLATQEELDQAVAQEVMNKINALPNPVTLEHETAVNQANEAYNALTNAQKGYVTNLEKLVDAKVQIANLKANQTDKTAAKAVMDLIDGLSKTITLDDESAVLAAREAYNVLTDIQKDMVTNIIILTGAEKTIANIKADKVTAKVVEDMIDALPQPSDITLENEQAVLDVQKAFDALTDAQKEYIGQVQKDKLAAALEVVNFVPAPPPVMLGDVDNNGKVDAKDALMVLKATVGKIELTNKEKQATEVVGDQKIDAKDALEILKYTVEKITKFPIELQ